MLDGNSGPPPEVIPHQQSFTHRAWVENVRDYGLRLSFSRTRTHAQQMTKHRNWFFVSRSSSSPASALCVCDGVRARSSKIGVGSMVHITPER